MNVGREAVRVHDLRPCQQARSGQERRIASAVQGDGFIQAIVGNAKAAADDKPAAEFVREKPLGTPRETELRTEVVGRAVIERTAGANANATEFVGTRTEFDSSQVAILLRDRTEVFPA